MLHTVPLQSLLDWLFEPQGSNLVATSATVAPYKVLAIAVTKRMLYEENPLRWEWASCTNHTIYRRYRLVLPTCI